MSPVQDKHRLVAFARGVANLLLIKRIRQK